MLAIFSLMQQILFFLRLFSIYLCYWFYMILSYRQTSISIFTCGIFSLFFLGFDCLSDKFYGHTLVLVLIFAQPSMTSAVHTHKTFRHRNNSSLFFFIHFSVVGHLDFFHVLAIVNSAATKLGGACIFLNYDFLWVYA